MLNRLRLLLADHHAIHLAGFQLALVAVLSAGLALAGAPGPHETAHLTKQVVRVSAPKAPSATPLQAEPDAAPEGEVIRLQDLTPDEARAWNAAKPISTLPNPAAKPFVLKTEGVIDEGRALDCMTAAVYYEAAYETLEGQRAVAQVVLNRMRHPAYPKTVCGVIFQGAERTTGCQFTFTCDGALARKPDDALWARARKIATEALNGHVMKKVGNATHYHAVYVAPYWSPNLVKVQAIGAHIFYRWTGGWGLPPAFAGRYAGGVESAGVRMATLDKLTRDQGKAALAADQTAELAAAHVAPHAAPPPASTPEQEAAAPITSTVEATQEAKTILKPEELDWTGRPKPRVTPRIAN